MTSSSTTVTVLTPQDTIINNSTDVDHDNTITADYHRQQTENENEEEKTQTPSTCWESFSRKSGSHFNLMKNHLYGFYLPNFGFSIGTAVFSSLMPISLRDLNESDSTIGLVVSLLGIGRIISEIPISLLSLEFGPWIVMFVSTVTLTLVFILPTVELTTWSFIVAQSIGGLAIAGFATPRQECMQQVFKKHERSMVSGHMGALGRISYLVAPAAAGAVFHLDPSYAYLMGLLFLLMTVACVFSPEMIEVDRVLRAKHAEEEEKRKLEEEQEEHGGAAPLVLNDTTGNGDEGEVASPMSDTTNDDKSVEMKAKKDNDLLTSETDNRNNQEDEMISAESLMGSNPSQFALNAEHITNNNNNTNMSSSNRKNHASKRNEGKSIDEHHYSSPWEALKIHYKSVLGIGFIVLSVMSIRQARRLTITLRALDLNFNARDIGFILAGSFAVDTVFFWVSSEVVTRFGYASALAPLCFFYGAAFFVEAIQPNLTLHSLCICVYHFLASVILLELELFWH